MNIQATPTDQTMAAAVCSKDGRHLAMMPHLRTIFLGKMPSILLHTENMKLHHGWKPL